MLMSPMRDGTTTSKDRATQLLICEPLSFAICRRRNTCVGDMWMKTGQCQLCMICCEAEAANNGMSGLSGAWCEFPAHRVSACTFCPPCLYFFAHLPTVFLLFQNQRIRRQ